MDIELYFEERGEGAPLVLLHGNGESGEYFVHQMEEFAQFCRVIAVDTRGHGRSPRGEGEFSIGRFVEDLREFLDERGIMKADILGFSDGGNIAIGFALKYPKRVDRLILNGANLNPQGVKSSVQIPIILGYRIASFFACWSKNARSNAEMLGLMVKEPHIQPKELKKISARTLVIAGTKDMIKDSHTKQIYKNLPNAELAILEGDHFIANKNWQEFNAIVKKFLWAM